ncbi:DHHC palmitoyltransferase-domain-containing protein [Kalaharituber pfeilii]|nr:DHHC palmitoyltransferase-domain-containing protein [Kalaharituber pfeilii]
MPIQVTPRVQTLLLVFTLLLTTFLSYLPQHTLLRPSSAYHPTWTTSHSVIFNFLVGCIYVSYLRAVVTDPGRPRPGWVPDGVDEVKKEKRDGDRDGDREGKLWGRSAGRWCKKCEAWKPPRCHHCRKCGRCVLRMDHHCPWTANCVGYRNLPHFLRFISYASVTTLYLEYHLIAILMHIWDLPSTSPSTPSFRTLIYILVTLLVNTLTTFSLNILTLRCLYSACLGTTTIEHWEQDRHASLVRRKVVRRVIFPWDIGIWENLCEAMGTWKAWEWLWVGAKTRQDWDPSQPSGWDWERDGGGGVRWEVNGFEGMLMCSSRSLWDCFFS